MDAVRGETGSRHSSELDPDTESVLKEIKSQRAK